MAVFKEIMRPAVSTGMSVTRVGGVGQNKRQKALAGATSKALSAYRQAEEYAHFGSELSAESTAALRKGKNLYALFNQIIGETYSLIDQQFLLDIIHGLTMEETIDIDGLKKAVAEYSERLQDDDTDKSNFDALRDELKARFMVQHAEEAPKPVPEEKPVETSAKEKKPKKKGEKTDKVQKTEESEKLVAPEVIIPAEADKASAEPDKESDDESAEQKDDKKEETSK